MHDGGLLAFGQILKSLETLAVGVLSSVRCEGVLVIFTITGFVVTCYVKSLLRISLKVRYHPPLYFPW